MNDLTLSGVRADSMLGYLKALGLLRTIALQREAGVRGRWEGATFHLEGELSRAELESFLLNDYRPMPVFNPWNNGAGFDPKSANKAAGQTLQRVAATTSARWASARAVLERARAIVAEVDALGVASEARKKKILERLREKYPDEALAWLDAAVVVGRADLDFPRILGSGGNDGHLDFSVNFLQRALDVAGEGKVTGRRELLADALDGGSLGNLQSGVAIGQYSPLGTGGPNATAGFDADSLVNPWDFVLMIEGAVVFAGALVKRFSATTARAAFPFTFTTTAGGFGSASDEEDSRGEMWLPRWTGRASFGAVAHMIRTGRVDVDSSVNSRHPSARAASSAIEAAQATLSRGVANGIAGFDRIVIAQRNGLAFSAVHVDYFDCRPKPLDVAAAALAREADRWVRRVAGKEKLGGAARRALREYYDAVFTYTKHRDIRALQGWLSALGQLDRAVGLAPPEDIAPFSFRDGVAADNVASALASDPTPEHALAAGWASVGYQKPDFAMRAELSPVEWDGSKFRYTRYDVKERTLNRVLARACVARFRKASDMESRAPIAGDPSSRVSLPVVAKYVNGEIPDSSLARVERLLAGYVLVPPIPRFKNVPQPENASEKPPVAWSVIKLLFDGFSTRPEDGRLLTLPLDPEVPALLFVNQGKSALERAWRNGQVAASVASQLADRPIRDVRFAELPEPARCVAALLLPIDRGALDTLALKKGN
jgi:CRISPR-associated protein Csx17